MDTEPTDLQVRAAAALASFAAKDPRWQALGTPVATKLVRENPLRIGAWCEAFQPVSGPLTRPLVALYGDRSRPEERASAYTLLFGFATQPRNPNRPEDLAELVADADPPQFRQILDQLADPEDRRRALVRLAPKLDSPARFDDALARRQGRVAAGLVVLGYPDRAWPQLRLEGGGGDPSVRTELIHNLAKFFADPRALIARFRSELDISARRALLLALGEYPIGQIPANERQALTATLRDAYATDPDPGLHSAIDWLLRGQWGQAGELDRNDRQLAGPGLPASRDWYVNTQGQTMAIIRDAGEFQMGSPPNEAGRNANEIQHRVRIGRSFAIATRKVTVAQYAAFLDQNPDALRIDMQEDVKSYISTPDCPMIKVDWYDAARYCNWLSRQEGIPEDQWCYPKAIRPRMRLPLDYLRRTGYRLPTDAEWEYACRAGSAASRFYGGSEALLPNFAWFGQNAGKQAHPVGRLKPNDLGLFDMLGNAFDWTQDPYGGPRGMVAFGVAGVNIVSSDATVQDYGDPYHTGPEARTFPDVEIDVPVSDDTVRLMRGCSFFFPASALRCAGRDALPPSARNYSAGFRPARTIR